MSLARVIIRRALRNAVPSRHSREVAALRARVRQLEADNASMRETIAEATERLDKMLEGARVT